MIIGGSDAGISAGPRARELDPTTEVTVVVADSYPNFSISGIPYYVSGEVGHWTRLAHRTHADLEATGMRLLLDTRATAIDTATRTVRIERSDGSSGSSPMTAGRRHRRTAGLAADRWARPAGAGRRCPPAALDG